MKKITYEESQIKELVNVLNGIRVTGIEQARRLAYAASILDMGKEEEDGDREHC